MAPRAGFYKQRTPGTEITRSTPPSGPEGQFPALCPDHCRSSRLEVTAAHLQTRGASPRPLKRKQDTQSCQALLPTARSSRSTEAGERTAPATCAPRDAAANHLRHAADPAGAGGDRGRGPPPRAPQLDFSGAGNVSSAPSGAARRRDGGDGGGASESPVGLFTTPRPLPTLAHSRRGRRKQSRYTRAQVGRWRSVRKPYR